MSALAAVRPQPRQFSMAELVERTGVPAATVRFYLAEGLLPSPVQAAPNRFLYDERHVELVRLVRLLRERRGLGLAAIKDLLPELAPDLFGRPEGGVFRPEIWRQLLAVHDRAAIPSAAARRLIDAGLEAFGQRGLAEVSVDDLCRAAGVAKGSFYRHFAAKEEVFLAVVNETGASLAEHLGTGRGGGREALAGELAEALSPFLVILADLVRLSAQDRPGLRQALAAWRASLVAALCRRDGRLDDRAAGAVVDLAIGRSIGRIPPQ